MKKTKENCCELDLTELSPLFKALGDTNRMAIFSHICKCEGQGQAGTNVKDVSSCCDVDLSVVSRHLSTLKKAGVLTANKKGKEVFYSMNGGFLASLLRRMADLIETNSCCSSNQED
jgi:ArsR family transcriptional regulator